MAKKRKLGGTDLLIAPLVLGGNVFGWTADEKASFRILDKFSAEGFNCIDTADVYSRWIPGHKGGESETIIGKWMNEKSNRDKIVISTKVGSDIGQGKTDNSKKHILWAVEGSLKRLQTDYIDLYQTHFDDDITPVEETLEAYSQLIKEGKVRWIGTSNMSPARIKASLEASSKSGYPRYESLQPHYNLYERELFEKELEQLCMDNGLGVICYFSLARGFLAGKYRSENDMSRSARGAGVKKYLDPRGFKILDALDVTAKQYNTTQASIAIAWLQARKSITAPIASATNISQLESLLNASEISLSTETLDKLNKASEWK